MAASTQPGQKNPMMSSIVSAVLLVNLQTLFLQKTRKQPFATFPLLIFMAQIGASARLMPVCCALAAFAFA